MKDFTRGGQTTLHNLRMIMQIVRKLFLVFFIVLGLYISYWWWGGYAQVKYPLNLLESFISANYRLALGHGADPMPFEDAHFVTYQAYPASVVNSPVVINNLNFLKNYFWEGTFYGSTTGLACALLFAQLLLRIGKAQRNSRFMRGIELVSPLHLKQRLQKAKLASHITVAGIPIIQGSECAHFLMTGSPGTGKSVCMSELLDQVRAKGQRAIVYDKMGHFVKHYYRPGKDIILNPLDERCPAWNIWAECHHVSDFDTMAASLMPQPISNVDPFWVNGARTIFAAAASRLAEKGETSTQQLLHYLLAEDLEALATLLEGTEAETLVSDKTAKTALSVKSVLATYLKSFKYLKEKGEGEDVFSIRDWVADDNQDSWLFVSSRADKHESLKPLISAWLETAGNALMSLGQSRERRVWMCLDELPSLHRLPYLSAMLAESRQFGGCLIAAMQSMAQLRDIYGENAAEAMSGLCNTRIFFRTPETRTATWVSKSLGEGEWDEPREGVSYGANTMRDGVSLNRQRVMRPVVTDTEIMNLPDLHAYLRLPGEWPVAKIQFDYQKRDVVANAFIARNSMPVESYKPSSTSSTSKLSQKTMEKNNGENKDAQKRINTAASGNYDSLIEFEE